MKRLILIAILLLSSPAWGLDVDLDDNKMLDEQFGGVNRDISDDISTLLAVANFAAARTALGLAIGTDVQAYDATILRSADIGATVQGILTAASKAEMEEGTEVGIRSMSPLRVAEAISSLAGTGAGDLKADGTVPLTADWDAEKAIQAESFTVPKTSGVAGDLGLYEANSTDTDTAGFRGPAALSANTSYRLAMPTAAPTSDNMTLTFSGTASTGSGTPSNPYVHTGTFTDLDTKAPAFFSFVIPAPATSDDINLLKAPNAITILSIACIVQGTTSVTGQLQECGTDGTSCADLDSDITCDADGAADDGTLTDAAIANGAWVRWKTTSISGTPTFLTVTVKYQ